jgi:hypothetical protein
MAGSLEITKNVSPLLPQFHPSWPACSGHPRLSLSM